MKNMKKLPLIVLIGSLSACGGDYGGPGLSSTTGTGNVLLGHAELVNGNGTTASPGAPADSNQFLATAYEDGLAEIQLSQLALQRSTNGEVRKFAQRLLDQHTTMNNAITQLAQQKNIALPTTLPASLQAQVTQLSALPAEQFDRAYTQLNVTAHETDIAAARLQARQGTDEDVREFAKISLPILKVHLAAAEEVHSLLDPAFFLAHAFQDGLAEIQISQLAVERASDPDVRQFAQRMIDRHTQANADIASLAQQKNVSLPNAPTAEQQAAASELAGFSGADFDEAYMDLNVIAHVKDARLFRQQARRGIDTDVRRLAADKAPALIEHLISALEIDRSVEPSFLFRAYQDGEAEIAVSHLALRKTENADVRAFAQRMIDEHRAANAQITQLAQQKNIALPSELAPEHLLVFAEFSGMTAQEFDRAYMEANVRVHSKDAEEATREAAEATDPDIRAYAQTAATTLNAHLETARALRDSVNATAEPAQAAQPAAPAQ